MLTVFLLTLAIVAISLLLLGVGILFKRKFPNTHVGGNKALNKEGVYCAQTQDYMEYNGIRPMSKAQKEKTKNKKE